MHTVDPIRFRGLLDHVGRSDLRGNFHDYDYERLSEQKSAERKKIVNFISSYFGENDRLSVLSMPGKYWFFERSLNAVRKKSQFVGVEQSKTIIHRHKVNMINSHDEMRHKICEFGNGSYQYLRTNGATKRCKSNRFLHMRIEDFVSILTENYGATAKQLKKFHKKFYLRNCAWLDFTGQICPSFDKAIANLSFAMNPYVKNKPVVITFMYGRDIKGKELGRINHITKLNRSLRAIDCWTYLGAGNCKMITIACEHID